MTFNNSASGKELPGEFTTQGVNMERQISRCRSCDARIFWGTTENGKTIPIDADESNGNLYLDGDVWKVASLINQPPPEAPRHKSHFATCPNKHRKSK